MPLLRKQQFVRNSPPANLKPDDEVLYCEATKEVFTNYDDFFQRTILCNSLVWSCSVTGKSNLTFEEAIESEEKARKRIGNLPKPLKRGILWLAAHTKRGRIAEVADDVYDFTKQRYFKGEIIEAVINDQWCDAKITKIIPPTQAEIDQANEEDDEITEVEKDGSPKKDKPPAKQSTSGTPDHLFKYEVEEVEPDDEDMVMLHIIPAEDVKREKGVFTRDKLNLYLKNVIELEGMHFKVKEKVSKMYDLDKVRFEDIFSGIPPQFAETQNKKAVLNKNKKGQFTLDGWIKEQKLSQNKETKQQTVKQKKQTPEELEAEMKRMREAQAKYKEDMKLKLEEEKKKRAEERAKEKERKKEEQKLAKDLIQEWNRRRDDLECEDLKELPKPEPIHCHIPNHLFGEFVSILEFLNSFSDMLSLKHSYPGGLTFTELETALTEKEVPDGSFFEIMSFMLLSVFDLQAEEMEEAKADKDESALDEADRNILGKDEEIARAIKAATETANYTKKNLGLALRDCHMDIWSLTEILRLHLESSGAFRGHNLQNWRYQQRGGYRLSDDPGFQFCMDEPQILASLQENIVTELPVSDKLKILSCLMNQMLTYAGMRDEIDSRMDNMIEAGKELREAMLQESRRIKEQAAEEKREKKEELIKRKEEILKESLKEGAEKNTEEKKETMTDRQKEALKLEEEKKEKEKTRKEEIKRSEFLDREKELQGAIYDYQSKVYVHCLGRDRAYRRYWMFDSIPGIFVEHDDDEIGDCLETPTPWNPDAGPLSEEEALTQAKKILAAGTENGEVLDNKLNEVSKTYAKKPVLKQQVLTANGGLGVKEEVVVKEEIYIEQENGSHTEEQVERVPPWGRCEGNKDSCPVHSTILPRTKWAYFSSAEELDKLIDSLNARGIRERELRDRLISDRENIEYRLKKTHKSVPMLIKTDEDIEKESERILETLKKNRSKNSKYGGALALPVGTPMKDIVEISLRDQILELEEKIFMGSLGTLGVKDRDAWQNSIQTRSYDMGADELTWGGEEGDKLTPEMLEAESRANTPDSNKRSSSGSSTAFNQNIVVRQLSAAILQVGQMIKEEEKYLKSPLGEDEKERKRRLREEERRRKEREAEEEDGVICEEKDQDSLSPFQRWEISLMSSKNIGQLYLHLTTLDNSIVWSKSIMNTKCRICRRKTDPDKMLLCDGCDRGHHLYCLKPKLKNVPSGDWFCSDCKPKERVRSPKKKVRRVFSSTEEEEDDDEDIRGAEEEADDDDDQPLMEDDENDEDYRSIKKKKPKAKKKIFQESEPEPKKKKKGGIANLLGKRKVAAVEEDEESEASEDEETERRSSRAKRKNNREEENKENTRSKRRRGDLDDDIELQFNVSGLEDLVKGMLNHKDGWPFDRPITKADAPDYHKIIKNPMDLGTIRSRLNSLVYKCNQEVLDDIRLMFKNCLQYNMEDAEEYQCAIRLEKYFEKEISKMGLSEEPIKSKRSRRTL